MTEQAQAALFARAVELWGRDAQMLMVVEECGELSQAVLRFLRERPITGAEIADEIADVTIMCGQLSAMLGLGEMVQERIEYKLARLQVRVEKASENLTAADRSA